MSYCSIRVPGYLWMVLACFSMSQWPGQEAAACVKPILNRPTCQTSNYFSVKYEFGTSSEKSARMRHRWEVWDILGPCRVMNFWGLGRQVYGVCTVCVMIARHLQVLQVLYTHATGAHWNTAVDHSFQGMQDPQKVSQLQRFVYAAPATSSHLQPYFDIFAQLHVSSLCQPLDVTMTTRNAEFKQIGQELRKKNKQNAGNSPEACQGGQRTLVSQREPETQDRLWSMATFPTAWLRKCFCFFAGFLALHAERMFRFGWQTHKPTRLGLLEGCYHRLKACFVICTIKLHRDSTESRWRELREQCSSWLYAAFCLHSYNPLDVTHEHETVPCQILPDIDITRHYQVSSGFFSFQFSYLDISSEFGIVSWQLRRGLNTPRGLWGT